MNRGEISGLLVIVLVERSTFREYGWAMTGPSGITGLVEVGVGIVIICGSSLDRHAPQDALVGERFNRAPRG